MASLYLCLDTGAAPQGGTETQQVSSPSTLSAWQTAAATALSTYGGFIQVTEMADINSNTPTKLINLARVKEVLVGP
jgi:hypothetical protein